MDNSISMARLASAQYKAAQGQPGALSNCERCYAVHTLPLAEARAEGQLHRQGFRTFQPKRHKTARHARRLSKVETRFFPATCSSSSISRIIGVAQRQRYLWGISVGDVRRSAAFGSARVVEALTAAADTRQHSAIRLVAGPFAEQLAILDELDDT